MKLGFLFLVLFLCACTAQTPRFSATGTEAGCKPQYLTDGDAATYWTCGAQVEKPAIMLTYKKPVPVDEVRVSEFEREPSRVAAYLLEGCSGGVWMKLGYVSGEEGHPVSIAFSGVMVTGLKLTVLLKDNARSPKISALEVLCSPAGEAQARTYDYN